MEVGQRRFTSGHRTVGGEEEDRNNHEEPSNGLHEKQKYGRRYGRRQTYLRLGVDGRQYIYSSAYCREPNPDRNNKK